MAAPIAATSATAASPSIMRHATIAAVSAAPLWSVPGNALARRVAARRFEGQIVDLDPRVGPRRPEAREQVVAPRLLRVEADAQPLVLRAVPELDLEDHLARRVAV